MSLVSFPDPPPKRKGGSIGGRAKEVCKGVMSKDKWFVLWKPSTGG